MRFSAMNTESKVNTGSRWFTIASEKEWSEIDVRCHRTLDRNLSRKGLAFNSIDIDSERK